MEPRGPASGTSAGKMIVGDDGFVEWLEEALYPGGAGGRDGDGGEDTAFREVRWEDGVDPAGVCGTLRRPSRSTCADCRPFRDDRACDR